MRRRALVTGVGGFLGSHIGRALVADGWQVVGLTRPTGSDWRLVGLPAELEIEPLDLGLEAAALTRLVGRLSPQLVVHAAARSAYAPHDLPAAVRDDVLGVAHLLAALPDRGCCLVALGSSLEVATGPLPVTELQPLQPGSRRGTLRAASSLLVLDEARTRGLAAGVLRVFSAYGPWEAEHRLVPKSLRAALLGEPLPLTSPPWPTHDFVFAADVALACLVAASAAQFPGHTWNVCSGRATNDGELVDLVERVTGRAVDRQPGAWTSNHPERTHWCGDPTRTAEQLGWRASTSLEEGLARTASWLGPRLVGVPA